MQPHQELPGWERLIILPCSVLSSSIPGAVRQQQQQIWGSPALLTPSSQAEPLHGHLALKPGPAQALPKPRELHLPQGYVQLQIKENPNCSRALPEKPTSPSFVLCSTAEIKVTNSPTCLGLHPGVPIWSAQLRAVLKAQVPTGGESELPVPPVVFHIPSRQTGALGCSDHGQPTPAPARQGEISTPERPLAQSTNTELSAASLPNARSQPMQNTTPAGKITGECAASMGKTLPMLY